MIITRTKNNFSKQLKTVQRLGLTWYKLHINRVYTCEGAFLAVYFYVSSMWTCMSANIHALKLLIFSKEKNKHTHKHICLKWESDWPCWWKIPSSLDCRTLSEPKSDMSHLGGHKATHQWQYLQGTSLCGAHFQPRQHQPLQNQLELQKLSHT